MRNERAAIMALTFCIGFTTAFIAYGLPVSYISVAEVPTSQTASVTDAVAVATPKANQMVAAAEVAQTPSGLYFKRDGEETLISVSAATAPDMPEAHTAVHMAQVGPNQDLVFFCTETQATENGCVPQVYSHETFSVHTVSFDGEPMTIEPETFSASWEADGRLNLSGVMSVDATQPWVL